MDKRNEEWGEVLGSCNANSYSLITVCLSESRQTHAGIQLSPCCRAEVISRGFLHPSLSLTNTDVALVNKAEP